jgi:hypothetical protein
MADRMLPRAGTDIMTRELKTISTHFSLVILNSRIPQFPPLKNFFHLQVFTRLVRFTS